MITWPEKDPAEQFAVGFHFAGELLTGETIATATVQVVVLRGTDASPAALLSGPAEFQTDRVLQTIAGGLSGVVYGLRCVAQTSAGRTLVRAARLPVMSAERW